MRFQVPQFVEIEDKIIGPFTLKQFLIYVAGAMVLVPVYLFSDLSLFITVALPVLGIAVAFAHVKINGKSLFSVIMQGAFYVMSPQLFIWRRTNTVKTFSIHDSVWHQALEGERLGQRSQRSLHSIAHNLATDGNVVTTEEVEDELVSSPASNQ